MVAMSQTYATRIGKINLWANLGILYRKIAVIGNRGIPEPSLMSLYVAGR
jgi:hypothetical protein